MASPFRARDCPCYSNRQIVCLHCAKYVKEKNRVNFTECHQINYEQVYDTCIDLSFSYKPLVLCDCCAVYLKRRATGATRERYLTPAIFKSPSYRHSNCYVKAVFEETNGNLVNKRYPANIKYPQTSNVVQPVSSIVRSDSDEEPVREAMDFNFDSDEEWESFSQCDSDDDSDYDPDLQPSKAVQLKDGITQEQATNLIKYLNLPPDHAEVVFSFLKKFTYTEIGFRITKYRDRTAALRPLFKTINGVVVLTDIRG